MRVLRPYQVEAVMQLAESNLYINHQCGLGKTVTAIEAVKSLRATAGPGITREALVVVSPRVAVWQWVRELRRQDPGALVMVLEDGQVVLGHRPYIPEVGPSGGVAAWFVTHHETLIQSNPVIHGILFERHWLAVVADEAHKFNNKDSKRTVALKSLLAMRRIALSGTKMEKKPSDMWSMLNWLAPDEFRSYWKYHDKFVLEMPGYNDHKLVVGVKNAPELAQLLKPIIHRKTRAQVAPEVPKKIVTVVPLKMFKDQQALYTKVRKSWDIEVDLGGLDPLIINSGATKVLRLQQICGYPQLLEAYVGRGPVSGIGSVKVDWVENYVANNPDEQMVVFARFRETAIHLASLLGAALVIGGRKPKNLDKFLAGRVQCLVGTIKAMGTALDLPMASTAIYVELEHSSLDMRQSADRIHRMTTTEPPNLIYLMAEKSVDYDIMESFVDKLNTDNMIDMALERAREEDTASAVATITEERIEAWLQED